MRILLIGQCSLHWGRMEYGNLGNYAIIEPLVRELHRVFPKVEIRTTFQMSEEFCKREKVEVLPLSYYYDWTKYDLPRSIYEVVVALLSTIIPLEVLFTPYMQEVLKADLIIDYSGDIWGDNATLLGNNRFVVGVLKDYVAKLLKKPIALLAGSPGPFSSRLSKSLARFMFSHFDLVTNREPISTELLASTRIHCRNMYTLACPAFLFRESLDDQLIERVRSEFLDEDTRPKIGFILCGWNMPKGPYSRWPREDSEYDVFVEVVTHMTEKLGGIVYLVSHNNGFDPPPQFMMKRGRDYQIASQLFSILEQRGQTNDVQLINGIYDAAQTKALIGCFDMLVSGRIHGAVAALTQSIPTVILDYGHEPKAHKLRGFAQVAEVDDYVADPSSLSDVLQKIDSCWENRASFRAHLLRQIPEVRSLARSNFELLRNLVRVD